MTFTEIGRAFRPFDRSRGFCQVHLAIWPDAGRAVTARPFCAMIVNKVTKYASFTVFDRSR